MYKCYEINMCYEIMYYENMCENMCYEIMYENMCMKICMKICVMKLCIMKLKLCEVTRLPWSRKRTSVVLYISAIWHRAFSRSDQGNLTPKVMIKCVCVCVCVCV